MKLVRFGEPGRERPGLIDPDGVIRDLSRHVGDIGGAELSPATLARLAALNTGKLPAVEPGTRLGPCVSAPSKFLAIGLNYFDHARELDLEIPDHPVLFSKAPSCISGPHDPVILPPGSQKTDWEVELAVVIGTRASNIGPGDALSHVAGYCIVNDVSERSFQNDFSGQWIKGKSYDGFGPMGPWLVTRDEVGDPHALDLWLEVNGERQQSGSTADMIFPLDRTIAEISRFMSLLPGDVITTGTPPGVGTGQSPQRFLKPGDVMRLAITGLGEQRQDVRAHDGA